MIMMKLLIAEKKTAHELSIAYIPYLMVYYCTSISKTLCAEKQRTNDLYAHYQSQKRDSSKILNQSHMANLCLWNKSCISMF